VYVLTVLEDDVALGKLADKSAPVGENESGLAL